MNKFIDTIMILLVGFLSIMAGVLVTVSVPFAIIYLIYVLITWLIGCRG